MFYFNITLNMCRRKLKLKVLNVLSGSAQTWANWGCSVFAQWVFVQRQK